MLFFGRNALTFGRGTTCSLTIILPLWGLRGITCLSLTASGGANLGEGCRDFDVGKIAESARFAEEEDLSLKTAVCLIERSELWMVAFCGFRRKT